MRNEGPFTKDELMHFKMWLAERITHLNNMAAILITQDATVAEISCVMTGGAAAASVLETLNHMKPKVEHGPVSLPQS